MEVLEVMPYISYSQEAEDDDSNDTVELPSTRKRIIMEDEDEDNDDGNHLKLQWEESQDVSALVKSKSLIEGLTRTNTEDLFASQSKKSECFTYLQCVKRNGNLCYGRFLLKI